VNGRDEGVTVGSGLNGANAVQIQKIHVKINPYISILRPTVAMVSVRLVVVGAKDL
jgi:hypothetical protein